MGSHISAARDSWYYGKVALGGPEGIEYTGPILKSAQ